MQVFSSCSKQGLALVAMASPIVAHGLSCPVACGILPDQGLNLYPLPWQADLNHQGNTSKHLYFEVR